ncbi:MAG TPA: phosphoribosyltransferase family protein [Gammaproteobacteria bacterium]|nr:phosphoribosyltransferase family protein [Gammaproteobacteria bacterium]
MSSPSTYAPPGEMLHSAEAVQAAIAHQAEWLRPRLANENPLVVVLLQGALYYAAWLTLALAIPLEIACVDVGRYGRGRSGGVLAWRQKLAADVGGRSVLLLDDIFDEGATLAAVRAACIAAKAREVRSAVLLRKRHDRARAQEPDSAALEVPDCFVVGCGLDDAGRWRNLPAIYALDERALPRSLPDRVAERIGT